MLTWGVAPLRRAAVLGAAAVALGALRLPGRPHTLCLFRAITGVPCPLCGGTTAASDLGRAHPVAALAANPVVVLGALALVLAASPAGIAAVRSWRALPGRYRVWVGAAILGSAELWQLVRFGIL